MNSHAPDAFWSLTDKEKQTLRLIVRGHDAKSTARSLGLSVHTINERLRDARRKMAVSSSREAARLLLEAEGATPDLLGDIEIGADCALPGEDQETTPTVGAGRGNRLWILIGVAIMTLLLGLLALTALPPATVAPAAPAAATTIPEVVDTAKQFLALGDQSRWDDGYRMTGTAFQKLNTAEVWANASKQARLPLGAMLSRTFLSEENLPAPPSGYEVVKFRTSFANKADAIETVTLEREAGGWKIVGVTIE